MARRILILILIAVVVAIVIAYIGLNYDPKIEPFQQVVF